MYFHRISRNVHHPVSNAGSDSIHLWKVKCDAVSVMLACTARRWLAMRRAPTTSLEWSLSIIRLSILGTLSWSTDHGSWLTATGQRGVLLDRRWVII